MKKSIFFLFFLLLNFCSVCYPVNYPVQEKKFIDFGVPVPISYSRGTVASVDGNGSDITLTWLFDVRGGYSLLVVYPDTGQSEQYPMPFPSGGDAPYASILSRSNKFYTLFNGYFCEFDPKLKKFSYVSKTKPQAAMAMGEDRDGKIWAVTYPNSGIVSFDPARNELTDFGYVYTQDWAQYPRSIAFDGSGWVYFGVGFALSQIVGFNPVSGKAILLLGDEDRLQNMSARVYQDSAEKIYASNGNNWYELNNGSARKLLKEPAVSRGNVISGDQSLFYKKLPSGSEIINLDLSNRSIVVRKKNTNEIKSSGFSYSSEGAGIISLLSASGGNVCGGTMFPFYFFCYSSKANGFKSVEIKSQLNVIENGGSRIIAGGYPLGDLIEINIFGDNYNYSTLVENKFGYLKRPHKLRLFPSGKWAVMSGTPQYGESTGGLLVHNFISGKSDLFAHEGILRYQSTFAISPVDCCNFIGGTTITPGTGGATKSKEAVIYYYSLEEGGLKWSRSLIPGAKIYNDLYYDGSRYVYGMADYSKFFVFDLIEKKIVYSFDTLSTLGRVPTQQGNNVFVPSSSGIIYLVFERYVASISANDFSINAIAKSPVKITTGAVFFDSMLYFGSSSHLYGYSISPH